MAQRKSAWLGGAFCLLGLLSPGLAGYPLQLSMGSAGNGSVVFSGPTDSFTFQNSTLPGSSGYTFAVNNQAGFTGSNTDVLGLQGAISGAYTVGPITTTGISQTAPVSGTGAFSIFDGLNSLTAMVNWVDIQTLGYSSAVSAGVLNTVGTVNLTGFSYSGSNAGLQELASNPGGTITATFQFSPAKDLTQLTTELSNATSYSASLSVVPEPSFYWLIALGMSGLLGLRRFRQS